MIAARPPAEVSGYVLAGGKSSRMGRDKALLELAGKPFIAHAVAKLRLVCAEVAVLSADSALARFAPLVPDLHPGCGPLGGIEAALAHSTREWSLILPVDVPFLPSAILDQWARATVEHGRRDGTRLAMYVVDGRPQPALLMIHRDLASYVSVALGRSEFRLLPVLTAATEDLAAQRGLAAGLLFRQWKCNEGSKFAFANLNTPEDFAEAERHGEALDRESDPLPSISSVLNTLPITPVE